MKINKKKIMLFNCFQVHSLYVPCTRVFSISNLKCKQKHSMCSRTGSIGSLNVNHLLSGPAPCLHFWRFGVAEGCLCGEVPILETSWNEARELLCEDLVHLLDKYFYKFLQYCVTDVSVFYNFVLLNCSTTFAFFNVHEESERWAGVSNFESMLKLVWSNSSEG